MHLIVLVDFLGQVDVQKVNKEKLFAKKHPSAAKQITSYRELEASLPILLSCSFPPQACNLLAAKHSSLAMINTSQNLGHISVLECTSEELFCLTPLGWIQGMAWGVSPGVSKHVSNFMGSEATRQIFGDGPGSLLAGA